MSPSTLKVRGELLSLSGQLARAEARLELEGLRLQGLRRELDAARAENRELRRRLAELQRPWGEDGQHA